MIKKKFKVSVIIPVYNVEKYLEECLNSVYNQTLKSLEIILVNDGSTDLSLKILEKYKKIYPHKTQLISKANGGQSSARNLGYKRAKGEYIAFIDSDDFIHLEMFERMYYEAKKNDLDIIQCAYENYFSNDINKNFPYKFIKDDSEVMTGMDYFELDPSVSPCDKIYNKDFLDLINFKFEEGIYAEDALALSKLFYFAKRVNYLNKIFYFYRRERAGSTTNAIDISKNIKLVKDKYYVVSELDKFKEKKKWNGNISRIIIANIITPFLKKEMKVKEYRQILYKEANKQGIIKIFFKNIKFKNLKKLIFVLIVRITKEGKI